MAELEQEITIARPPGDVWKTVGEFGGLEQWLPGVEACTVDGDKRTISMMGLDVVEQLRCRNDDARSLSYSVIDVPVPIESHLATLTVHAADEGSRVTWHVAVVPDEMLSIFTDVYKQGLQALKAHCEE